MQTTELDLRRIHKELVDYVFQREFKDIDVKVSISKDIDRNKLGGICVEVVVYFFVEDLMKDCKIITLRNFYTVKENTKLSEEIILLLDSKTIKVLS